MLTEPQTKTVTIKNCEKKPLTKTKMKNQNQNVLNQNQRHIPQQQLLQTVIKN